MDLKTLALVCTVAGSAVGVGWGGHSYVQHQVQSHDGEHTEYLLEQAFSDWRSAEYRRDLEGQLSDLDRCMQLSPSPQEREWCRVMFERVRHELCSTFPESYWCR